MNLSKNELAKKLEELKAYKTPLSEDKYVGVELEFSCPAPEDVLHNMLIDRGLDKFVTTGADGGAWEGEHAYEWRIMCKQNEMEGVLTSFGKLISEMGGKHHPESGFHVHLDMRQRDPAKCYNNLVRVQNILLGMTDPIRVKGQGARWCHPQKSTFLGEADRGKYCAINPLLKSNKNTIEVRLRESVTDGLDIYHWTRFLCILCDTSKLEITFKNIGELERNVRLPKYIRDYIRAKLSQHKQEALLVEEFVA